MKGKKIAALIMTGVMMLSMGATAFAADETALTADGDLGAAGGSIKIETAAVAPTIKVTVKGVAGEAILNPYKLAVKSDLSDKAGDGDTETVSDQVLSAPVYLLNGGDTNIKVSAAVTGTPSTGVVLAAADWNGGKTVPTTKSVFMYMQSGLATKADGEGDPAWGEFDKAADIVVATKAAAAKVIGTIEPADDADAPTTKAILAVRLSGVANGASTTAWAAADKVDVGIAFSFLPTSEAVE